MKLTQYSTVFPETLKCLSWSRNSPNFMESERSFHCQELNITCHYLQPYESNVRYPILVLKDQFLTLSSRLLPDFSCGSLLKISSSKTSVFFFSLPMKITSAYKCRCRSLIPHVLEIRLASSPMRYVNGKHTTFPIRILYILTKERGKIKETNILLDEDCGT